MGEGGGVDGGEGVASVLRTLARLRANVVGVVLNEVNRHTSDSYYYYGYYGRYYNHYHGQKKYDAAAADYRKSIEIGGGADDGCACEPYESLVALYTVETRQYDEAWEMVHLAQRSNRRLSPELMERFLEGMRKAGLNET